MFRRSLFRLNAFGLVVLVGLLLAAFARPQVAAPVVGPRGIESFCARPGPSVYAPGLAALPAVHSLPEAAHDGRGFEPPFAPAGVQIQAPELDPPILAGAVPYLIGYRLTQRGEGPGAKVDWTLELGISQVDSQGESAEPISARKVHVTHVSTASKPTIALSLPRRDGFYRVDLKISDAEGSPLGEYAEYVQVLPEVIKARLAINSRRFRTGQTVAFRVENLGSIGLSETGPYSVQRHTAAGWRPVKRFDGGAIPLVLVLLGPEAAGSCTKLSLPKDLQPGRYRIVAGAAAACGHLRGPRLKLVVPVDVRGTKRDLSPDDVHPVAAVPWQGQPGRGDGGARRRNGDQVSSPTVDPAKCLSGALALVLLSLALVSCGAVGGSTQMAASPTMISEEPDDDIPVVQ
jgi:hypothetical protein